jgi:hypothetical protein
VKEALNVFCVVLFAALAVAAIELCVGCGGALVAIDDPEIADTAAKLSKCRAEGRAASADAGPDAGWGAYTACKQDAGL